MSTDFDVVVPALSLRALDGSVDLAATRAYAQRAAATWVDFFLLSGSTTRGFEHRPSERAAVLDLWLALTPASRLLACCWKPDDLAHAAQRGIAPVAVMQGLADQTQALAFLRTLPSGAHIYSHPMFGGAVFDAGLAGAAREQGVLPAGGKLAKISTTEITKVHATTGYTFRLWDGSSRRIRASVDAGAAGVVATPLCAFDTELPAKDIDLLQAAVDSVQRTLDALPDRASRTAELISRARRG
jgi:hypothetical protein